MPRFKTSGHTLSTHDQITSFLKVYFLQFYLDILGRFIGLPSLLFCGNLAFCKQISQFDLAVTFTLIFYVKHALISCKPDVINIILTRLVFNEFVK